MSIAKRVEEAIDKMAAGDPEGALIPASIATDATAKIEYPKEKENNVAYRRFISDNLALITRLGWGIPIVGSLRFGYRHPKLKPDADGQCSFEQVMYFLVRCGLLHTGGLPAGLTFVEGNKIEVGAGGNTLTLPTQLILGLLAAVVVSPVNAGESTAKIYPLKYHGRPLQLQRFWGQKTKFMAEIERLEAE